MVGEGTSSHFAAFNFGNPARLDPGWMASPGLREALLRVIDRDRYAEEVFGGYIDVERAGFMTQPWAIDRSVRNPKRDVAAARRLLEENGWADYDGDGVVDSPSGDRGVFVCIVRDDADIALLAVLASVAADFTELGFELDVQALAVDDFTTRWTSTFDYDLIAMTLHQYAAFNEFDLVGSAWSIRRNASGWNPGGYWNPAVDEAILSYFSAWDQPSMRSALHIIQQQTNDDPFALWFGFPRELGLSGPTFPASSPTRCGRPLTRGGSGEATTRRSLLQSRRLQLRARLQPRARYRRSRQLPLRHRRLHRPWPLLRQPRTTMTVECLYAADSSAIPDTCLEEPVCPMTR